MHELVTVNTDLSMHGSTMKSMLWFVTLCTSSRFLFCFGGGVTGTFDLKRKTLCDASNLLR